MIYNEWKFSLQPITYKNLVLWKKLLYISDITYSIKQLTTLNYVS